MKKVSIMVPAYNEQESIPLLYEAILEIIDSSEMQRYCWEVLFVNDGSDDSTLEAIKSLRKNDLRISYVDLSRNFGKENAMLAGFDFATGDCVIVMDADLQDPPYVIGEMLSKWEEGYEDVYAKRRTRGSESLIKKYVSLLFYKALNKMSKVEMLQNVGDFRLLDRRCVNVLKKMRESERYTKGLFCWIGYKKAVVMFDRADRVAGMTSWSFLSLIKLALDGVVSFTTAPLHIATWLGIAVSFIAFAYLLYVFFKTLVWGDPVAGYPTMMCVILLLGGIQLLFIGIIGEYVARMYNETKGRPVYIAREYNDELI